jgi:hypothetical protein
VGLAAVFVMVMAALPATLNTLKFGKPWDSGYRHIYERRWEKPDDWAAQRAKEGLFSYKFIPTNLYYMNLGFPLPDEPVYLLRFGPNSYGTGIWWTTPLLLFLPVALRRIWSDGGDRWLLISAGLVYGALMAYHVTGWAQLGYNRFSMDFMVVLLALVAPTCDQRKYDGWVLGFTLWSIWYFRWAI